VRSTADGEALSTFTRKQDAVARAKADLEASATGGVLEVLRRDRSREYRRTIRPSVVLGARQPPESFGQAFAGVRDSKKEADRIVDVGLGHVLPWIGLLAGPTLNALITPQVAEQRTVLGVFFATLAWSSGCLLAWLVIQVKPLGDLQGFPLASAVVACLLAGAFFAALVGVGAYSVPIVPQGSGPLGALFGFVGAAVATFGPLGALLGAASGAWAGYQVERLLKAAA
jgi:hypothetical protein